MPPRLNSLSQPIGPEVINWVPPPRPPRTPITGQYCRVEPLTPTHTADLLAANQTDSDGRMWTYLPYGPFTATDYAAWVERVCQSDDPLFHAIIDRTSNQAVGVASYLRIEPSVGCIEVGHIAYSPILQRTPAATEAMYLLMQRAFELGYRRYEWKCDALNAPSRAAAQRLGLSYEGIFRQATLYKGRNRDTAWYAAIDSEWPALREAFTQWLAPQNFDAHGQQHVRLSTLTCPLLYALG